MVRTRPLVLGAVAGLAAATLAALPAAAGAETATGRADARLDRSLRALVVRADGPPGAIAVIRRGRTRHVAVAGVADRTTGRRPGITDRMRLASTSKAFTGAVALHLVQQGRLALTDTIGRRLPALPPAWSAVTLAQLLHHTSGLPDYSASAAFGAVLQQDPRATLDSQGLWSYVADEPLLFAPGSQYRYSNTDNIVVALMAQAVTKRSYETLLRDFVTRPLGLRRTSLPSGVALASPFLHGYQLDPPAKPEDVSTALSPSGAWASGGMVSTPGDVSVFAGAYSGAKLFGRAVQRQQMQWVPGSSEPTGPGKNSAGLAIFRYQTSCGTVYGHTGNFPGYTQFFGGTKDGSRSATVSVTSVITPERTPAASRALRAAQALAVCAALAR